MAISRYLKKFSSLRLHASRKKCYSKIIDDSRFSWGESMGSPEEGNSTRKISLHNICPPEVSEDFSIIWNHTICFSKNLYSMIKVSTNNCNISFKIYTRTRVRMKFSCIGNNLFCFLEIILKKINISELLI